MAAFRALVVLAAFAAGAFAQADAIVVNASRTITLTPDEVMFELSLSTDLATTVDQAAALVREAGVTAGNLLQVASRQEYAGPPSALPASRWVYMFEVTHPYLRLKEIAEKLQAARRSAAASGFDLQFSLYVSPAQRSFDEARRQTMPALIAELRREAESLASATNMTLGPLIGLGEGQAGSPAVIPYARFLLGFPVAGGIQVTVQVYGRFAAQPK